VARGAGLKRGASGAQWGGNGGGEARVQGKQGNGAQFGARNGKRMARKPRWVKRREEEMEEKEDAIVREEEAEEEEAEEEEEEEEGEGEEAAEG